MNKADTNSLISDYLYHLRAGGKRLSVAESGPATTSSTMGYTHDGAGRLTQESGAYGTIAYTYDNVGNRLTRTVSGSATPALANGTTVNTYDANDWLASGAHFYDFDGNELLVNGVQASYDFENHLVQLGTRDYTAYAYDADGNRLSVATRVGTPSAGTPTAYLVDPLAPFARAVLEFPQGASYNAMRYEYGDDLLLRGGYGAASYYLYDGLGSTRQLTDANGVVTDGYLYDAYGVGLARTGSTVNSFLFQGQQYDAASGTYYLRARYYDQNSGRFLSQDPLEGNSDDPISLHRYLYANDDPANNVDPSGEETLCELSVSLGINTSLTASVFTIANRVYGAATTLSDAADLYYDWEATGTVDTGDVVNLAFDVVMPKLGPMLFKGLFGRWLCFTAGTSVAMADGSKKPIEKIEVGDLVFSRDEATGETQAKRVLQTFEHQVSETLVLHFRGGATVETTPNHPFYVDGKGFVPACQLGIGNSIITRAGPSAVLDSIEYRYKVVTVYNFEVEGFHTYFVGQDALWVHNHCTPLANWVSTQTKDTGNNATLLRKSLKGIIQAGEEAHHIVARTHRRADRARKLLDKFQIDINGAENGVGLVNNMHHGQGLHSFSGIDTVYDRLFAAQQGVKNWGKARAEIIFELQKIGAEQRAGTFQP